MKKISMLEAIKRKCIDCCCGDKKEVLNCSIKKCALYDFRLGNEAEKKYKK